MKVVIVGSGLIGVTTAYLLGRRGCAVTVIDRCEGPGMETSFANGALLTPSMPEPWNAPGCWRVLLGSLGRSDASLQLRLRALPSLAGWGIEFLRHSKAAHFERNTLTNVRMALYSLEVMRTLRSDTGIEYGRTARGSLRLFRDAGALEHALAAARHFSAAGLPFKKLSTAEAVALEPALAPIAAELAGAVHYPADETGDAYRFCVALTELARREGVEFHFRTPVTALRMSAGRIDGVETATRRYAADHYVVAAGSYSTQLLKEIGIALPVRPAKGYSLTFLVPQDKPLLGIPLIDDELHAAVVPVAGGIRIAGTAEFAGYDLTLDAARIRNLAKLTDAVLPQAGLDTHTAKAWCGLRPLSADGVPIVGPSPVANLWISTGHGHLGWTMAAGSAQLLSDLICGDQARIDAVPFALERFSRHARGDSPNLRRKARVKEDSSA